LLIQFNEESVVFKKTSNKFICLDDLIKEIIDSFDILQKMLKIPNVIFVIREFRGLSGYLFFYNIQIIGKYIYNCWETIPDDVKVSMISSILYFSMKYFKGVLFYDIPLDGKILMFCQICYMFYFIVFSGIKLFNTYFDLIRFHFEKSGWTEWLIHIFNVLNVLSSSPHSNIPPSLSFLSSISPSENTTYIVEITSKTIKMLLKSNTPKAVVEYLELRLPLLHTIKTNYHDHFKINFQSILNHYVSLKR
jgi:hypothetical protein